MLGHLTVALTALALGAPGGVHSANLDPPAPGLAPAPQPPERPPPEQPPAEEAQAGEDPEAPAETPPAGEESAEGAPGEEEGGEEDAATDADEPESGAAAGRAREVAAAPVGILPGEVVADPAPVSGVPVVGMVLGNDGLVLQTATGEVIAYEPDGRAARWGLPDARAVFVGEETGTLVILDESGEVLLRNVGDGLRVGGFATGLEPVRGGLRPTAPSRAPAALAAGTLYWVSGSSLYGYRVATGQPVLEAPLPDGEPASVVAAVPSGDEPDRAAAAPPLVLVSLGSGGVAAVAVPVGAVGAAVRWHAESAHPVTGPVVPLRDEGLAVYGDEGGDLTAVDLETGERRWRWRLREGFHYPPLASRGRLYAATKANSLYCFDAKRGGERWRAALPGRPASPPVRMAGAVLVVTRDGLVVEVNAETGERIGNPRDLGAEVLGLVRRSGDGAREDGWRDRRLFLGLRDGRLAILGPRTGRRES